MNERVASFSGSGYHAFILGKSVMMPDMARYESWNPADSRTDGLTAICIINAAQKVDRVAFPVQQMCGFIDEYEKECAHERRSGACGDGVSSGQ